MGIPPPPPKKKTTKQYENQDRNIRFFLDDEIFKFWGLNFHDISYGMVLKKPK